MPRDVEPLSPTPTELIFRLWNDADRDRDKAYAAFIKHLDDDAGWRRAWTSTLIKKAFDEILGASIHSDRARMLQQREQAADGTPDKPGAVGALEAIAQRNVDELYRMGVLGGKYLLGDCTLANLEEAIEDMRRNVQGSLRTLRFYQIVARALKRAGGGTQIVRDVIQHKKLAQLRDTSAQAAEKELV